MATQVKRRRGTRAENDVFTGAEAEFVYLEDEKRIVIHDGVITGGIDVPVYSDEFNNTYSYGVVSGTDVLTLTVDTAPAAYATGQSFSFKAANTNTGSVTINVNALGAKTIQKVDGTSLVNLEAEDLVQNAMYNIRYNGTVFIMESPSTLGGGVWEVISTQTLSSSVDIEFDSGIDSTYKKYRITCIGSDLSADNVLTLRTSTDGGATYDSGAADYSWSQVEVGIALSETNDASDQFIVLNNSTNIGAASAEGISNLEIILYNPSDTSQHTRIDWTMTYGSTVNVIKRVIGTGSRRSIGDVDAVLIELFGGGTFTTGSVSLEGWAGI
jgi:hypothetical protein